MAEWQVGEVDMAEVVREAVGAMGAILRTRGVRIDSRVPAHLPRVVADRDRVMQVLLNLLSNAVKFSPQDTGRVEVRVAVERQELRVDVEDNGIGIDRAHQAVIFEKFRQVGDPLTQKPAGSGLGLAICRRIVDHLGGRLWVRSEPGHGAVFSFTLPLPAAALRPAEPAAAAA